MKVKEYVNEGFPTLCDCCDETIKRGEKFLTIKHKELELLLAPKCFKEFMMEMKCYGVRA